MMRWSLRGGLLALIAVAGLAAGCGSDDDDEAAMFRQDAKAATGEVSAIGRDVERTIEGAEGQSNSALAAAFARLADRSREAVGDLEALEPPADARRQVDGLVAALGTGARDLDAIAVAARGGDPRAAASATAILVNDSPAISTANDALKAELKDVEK